MYKLLFIFLFLLSPAISKADTLEEIFSGLPKEEWVWQSLHAIDMAQTIRIAKNPDKFQELNPLLGKHPSTSEVVAFTVATSVAHAYLVYKLQEAGLPVKVFEYITIGYKGITIKKNIDAGLH